MEEISLLDEVRRTSTPSLYIFASSHSLPVEVDTEMASLQILIYKHYCYLLPAVIDIARQWLTVVAPEGLLQPHALILMARLISICA